MSLRSYQEYVDGLRDGRQVYYRGDRIPDVTTHAQMSIAIAHAGIDFRLADDPRYRGLAVRRAPDGSLYSTYFHLPRSSEDLTQRSKLIEAATPVWLTRTC